MALKLSMYDEPNLDLGENKLNFKYEFIKLKYLTNIFFKISIFFKK